MAQDAASPTGVKLVATAGVSAKSRFYSAIARVRQQTWMRVGATSGWVLTAIDNSMATMAASQTAGTLVIPFTGLKVGDVITGFSLSGTVTCNATANSVTINSALHSLQATANGITDTAIANATTSNIVTVNTCLNSTTAVKTGLSITVPVDTTYYLLVTGTTAAGVTAKLAGALVNVLEG